MQGLIDSIFRQYPIPPIFLHRIRSRGRGGQESTRYKIVDGQQRIRALADFHSDKFPLLEASDKKMRLTTRKSRPSSNAPRENVKSAARLSIRPMPSTITSRCRTRWAARSSSKTAASFTRPAIRAARCRPRLRPRKADRRPGTLRIVKSMDLRSSSVIRWFGWSENGMRRSSGRSASGCASCAQKGLSQEALALACDLDRTHIGGIERGEPNVSLVNIQKIATALCVAFRELF